ncbi:MAG: ATP-binding cassette domain-containing protein [Oscillospiraceae bacterium]|nr:ATP-binding cassette domain-containing protein [Oscillospiraceae bacterium]
MNLEPIIEIKNLSKVFGSGDGKVAALQDVSVAVKPGEIFGIIGLSGAGKSTLVRCINLLEHPTQGQVLFHGQDLTGLKDKELRLQRRKISMIFQSFNLLDQRTSLDNICFPLELAGVSRKDARQRAMELLEIVGLPDKANSYPVQLSGGQKQRIAIARALASDPEVLLCDEATSALDPQTTDSILKLLQKINRERGITVIIITHQMSVIEQICHRVAILDHGEVAEVGTVEAVFSNPKSKAGRRLVSPSVVLPLTDEMPIARIAFNGNTSSDPIIASVAMDLGVKVSIMGADTRNVDGRAFGTMLISLPEELNERRRILDYLNGFEGVTAEEVR